MSKRTLAPTVALLLLPLMAACSGDDTPATQSTPSASPAPTPTPEISYTTIPDDLDFKQFVSPTKNIGCVIGPTGGSCDVQEATWQAPPPGPDCPGDYNRQSVEFAEGGTAKAGSCATDTVYEARADVLEYGTGVIAGDFRCFSIRQGITCENTRTRHGFSVSRDSYRIF